MQEQIQQWDRHNQEKVGTWDIAPTKPLPCKSMLIDGCCPLGDQLALCLC